MTVPDAAGGPRRRLTGCTGGEWTRVVLDVMCEVALLCVLSLKNMYYLLNRVKVTTGPGIPRAAHDFAMVPAAARQLPLVPCKSWSHGHAALLDGS